MLSIADRMRAAEKLRQSPPSDSGAESKNVEESSGNENKTSQSKVSIAEKLRAAVAIATPRQSSLDVSGKSIGNNTQPMPSIVEKMKAKGTRFLRRQQQPGTAAATATTDRVVPRRDNDSNNSSNNNNNNLPFQVQHK